MIVTRARVLIVTALSLAAVVASVPAASGGPAQHASRPVAGKWKTDAMVGYYAVGTFHVTSDGKHVTKFVFKPNTPIEPQPGCVYKKTSVAGPLLIRRGGVNGAKFHIGRHVNGTDQATVRVTQGSAHATATLSILWRTRKVAAITFVQNGCSLPWTATPA